MAEQGKTQGGGSAGKQGGGNQGGGKEGFVTEITPQSEDFSRWYLDVVRRAELADYSPVKGCMVIRPYGYAIWELIQQALDKRFKATGHVNAYFPLFIPETLLHEGGRARRGLRAAGRVGHQGRQRRARGAAGRSVRRPRRSSGRCTRSGSSRGATCPMLINQWANVVRWEKVTRPFLRTTEFLWQEGHTAHETAERGRRKRR